MSMSWEQVDLLRKRAAEIRAVADEFTGPVTQDTMVRIAETYEQMADAMETRLKSSNSSIMRPQPRRRAKSDRRPKR